MSESLYRSRVVSRADELARLLKERSGCAKKIADSTTKAGRAQAAMSKTSSKSTIESKAREYQRAVAETGREQEKAARIEEKIAKKQKELSAAQLSLSREERRSADNRQLQEKKRVARDGEKRHAETTRTLALHKRQHREMAKALSDLQALPARITVLFLASNPLDQNQLRLDEEARAITEMIRRSKYRDSVDIRTCWAVRPGDLIQAVNEFTPTIVHFSGHGSTAAEILFQDDRGGTKLVPKDAIVQMMRACADGIRLVFFNNCYSNSQAQAVVEHVDAAIGMNSTVGDDAARVFAARFYSSIGFGLSIATAFSQARAELMLEGIQEEDTPELFVRVDLDGRDIVLIAPEKQEAG